VESSPKDLEDISVFCGFGGHLYIRGSAYYAVIGEHLSTLSVLNRAALLISNNTIIILHDKLKRIPGKR